MSIAYQRTEEQKVANKTKGDHAELEFICQIGRLGGYAVPTGRIPFDRQSCPRIQMPAKYSQSEQDHIYPRRVAPDVNFWWWDWPVVSMAQVKAKDLFGKVKDGSAFFWLDEEQLFKMNEAATTGGNVYFVVFCPELDAIPGLSVLSFVNVNDLHERKIRLFKTVSFGKPAFHIPLNVFKPISKIKDHIRDETFPAAQKADGGGDEDYPSDSIAAR